MKTLLKQWICQIIGHKAQDGYWLTYVIPTQKRLGLYHDLVICGRCGLPFRIDSGIITLKEYRGWQKK